MGTPQVQVFAIETDGLWTLRASVPLVGTGKVGPLHIFTEGDWEGHAEGPIHLTGEVFDAMVERFEAQQNPLAIDYEHKTFHKTNPDSRAAGWIQKLEKRRGENGFELWALVEWTDAAAEMIKTGEYRFCSPAFTFDAKDRKTNERVGPEIKNVALTNLPFLDGQSPIRLSFVCAVSAAESQPPPPSAEQQPAAPTPSAPPAPEQAAQDQARAMNEMLAAFLDAIGEAAGVDRAAVVAALGEMDIVDDIAGMVREHLDVDGMPQEKDMKPAEEKKPEAAPESDDDKRAKDIEARAQANENTILASRVEALEGRLTAAEQREKDAKDAAVKARIDAMVTDGALLETEREDATWTCSNRPEMFERVYGARKGAAKPVPIGVTQGGEEKVDPETFALSDMSNGDRVAYRLLTDNGMKGEAALKRIAAHRNKKVG